MNHLTRLLIIFFSFIGLSSCMPPEPLDQSQSSNKIEETYCTTRADFSGGVLVNGSATFQALQASSSGLGAPGSQTPIPYAEVQVRDSQGAIIQCTETDSTGAFSFYLPKGAGDYSVRITSRSDNQYLKVSVLKTPSGNAYHYIQKSFSVGATAATVVLDNINAPATDTLEGGAFNIHYQLWRANEFLRTNTANCSSYGCTQFTVAPKVVVYWAKGVNPVTYLDASGASSFFVPESQQIYILGGENGDVNLSDTDHFDNSIILHEYGHFIEYSYSGSDSPGGYHDANSVVDPRLAWSEGWANFFQAAVTNSPYYRDTSGNYLGTTFCIFDISIETATRDFPVATGEGNFREFSITRSLWDLYDTSIDGTDNVSLAFSAIWSAFTGLNTANNYFRNLGLFYEKLAVVLGSSLTANPVLVAEKQLATRKDYANPLSGGTSCSNVAIYASPDVDLFANNDYYHITHNGGSLTVKLTYTQSSTANLDLVLYIDDYIYGYKASAAAYSIRSYGVDLGVEQVSLSNLAAGQYMINVIASSSVGSIATNYYLEINGSKICPLY